MASNESAEEVLINIDNALLSEGYESYRWDQSKDHEQVWKAFWSFYCDWQNTKSGELRDYIIYLESLLKDHNVTFEEMADSG